MKISGAFALAAAVSSASAHTIFLSFNGGANGDGVRIPSYDGPIQEVTSNDIACNGGINPTKATSKVWTVQAGSSNTLLWKHQSGQVIDSSHKGPVMAYMKKVNNAASDTGAGSGWFKIYEDGFDGSQWGVDRLIAKGGIQTVTIPACIAPGQYLLRGELIALHAAGSPKGAQFYMECAQLNVIGGSASKTPSTVSLPGAYSATDPGILFNLYNGAKSYTIPGPKVFTC